MSKIRWCVMPLAALAIVACGATQDTGEAAQAASPDAPQSTVQPIEQAVAEPAVQADGDTAVTSGMHAMGAWARAVPPNAPVAGGFLMLHNVGTSDDRLVSASSPAAERVEIHEMAMDGEVMRMRQLTDGLAVPAGQMVELKPGGYHLMFIGPEPQAFRAGASVEVVLVFAQAGAQPVTFEVRGMGATDADDEHGDHGH